MARELTAQAIELSEPVSDRFGAVPDELAETFGTLDALGRLQIELYTAIARDALPSGVELTEGIITKRGTAVYTPVSADAKCILVGSLQQETKVPVLIISWEDATIEKATLAVAKKMLELGDWPFAARELTPGERSVFLGAVEKWYTDCAQSQQ